MLQQAKYYDTTMLPPPPSETTTTTTTHEEDEAHEQEVEGGEQQEQQEKTSTTIIMGRRRRHWMMSRWMKKRETAAAATTTTIITTLFLIAFVAVSLLSGIIIIIKESSWWPSSLSLPSSSDVQQDVIGFSYTNDKNNNNNNDIGIMGHHNYFHQQNDADEAEKDHDDNTLMRGGGGGDGRSSSSSSGSRRRRLIQQPLDSGEARHQQQQLQQLHRTLSPGARATVLMAHEMAIEHAKEQGKHIIQEREDPFQAMRGEVVAMRNANLQQEQNQQRAKLSFVLAANDNGDGGIREEKTIDTTTTKNEKEEKSLTTKQQKEEGEEETIISRLLNLDRIRQQRNHDEWKNLDPIFLNSASAAAATTSSKKRKNPLLPTPPPPPPTTTTKKEDHDDNVIQYLGVMIDAGRHYFPIDWLKQLILYLQQLHYNMIHFRLSDDQQFVVQLESLKSSFVEKDNDDDEKEEPLKTTSTTTTKKDDDRRRHWGSRGVGSTATGTSSQKRYTPSELKELVSFAKQHGIVMIPEINLPLGTASWATTTTTTTNISSSSGDRSPMVLECPNFICDTGYYIPLNLHHPQISQILENILKEILIVFDQPPMFHFGGTVSIHDADECFTEIINNNNNAAGSSSLPSTRSILRTTARTTRQYFEQWEQLLRSLLRKLSYPEEQVIRLQFTEESPKAKTKSNAYYGGTGKEEEEEEEVDEEQVLISLDRVGGTHYWKSIPSPSDDDVAGSIIISTGLDVAIDDDDDAWAFYSRTVDIMKSLSSSSSSSTTATATETKTKKKPTKAIVVSTSYLSPSLWLDRNVLARLIAVSMGVSSSSSFSSFGTKSAVKEDEADAKPSSSSSLSSSSSSLTMQEFDSQYAKYCQTLMGPKSESLCELKGHTVTSTQTFLTTLSKDNQEWRHTICKRLTDTVSERVFNPYTPDRNFATTMGNHVFWSSFHRLPTTYKPDFSKINSNNNKRGANNRKKGQRPQSVQELRHKVKKTGVIFDLANSLVSVADIQTLLLSYVAPLGYDMLQLRLSDDFAFAVRVQNIPKLPQSHWNEETQIPIPKLTDFEPLLDAASEWNIEVFPEVSITTNAGGWVNGGFLVQCPKRFCKYGTSIPNDIRDPNLLPVIYVVLKELRETFGGSSPYLHLGSDERAESLKCYEEDGLRKDEDPPFDVFERKLKKLLLMLGILPEHVIRYDNVEQLTYEGRVGGITHYNIPDEPGSMPDIREGEPFLMTADLLTRNGNIYSLYKDARSMAELNPLGVLGEIRTLDREVWKQQHMGIRLIALILGLSIWEGYDGQEELSQEDFVQKVIEVCRESNFPEYADDPQCQAAEKLLKSEKEVIDGTDDAIDERPTLFPIGTEKFREGRCAKFTRARKKVVMREKYVLKEE